MGDDGVFAVVIDNGSCYMKAGFAGDDSPQVFPSIMGRPRQEGLFVDQKSHYVGYAARSNQSYLSGLREPIQGGIITNRWDMEAIWEHIFKEELHIASEGSFFLLVLFSLFFLFLLFFSFCFL